MNKNSKCMLMVLLLIIAPCVLALGVQAVPHDKSESSFFQFTQPATEELVDFTKPTTSEDDTTPAESSDVPDGEEDAETGVVAHCYEALTDNAQKELYKLIDETAKSQKTDVKYNGELTVGQITRALDAYRNDHPEVFWLKNSYSYSIDKNLSEVTLEFNMKGSDIKNARQKFNAEVDRIVKGAPSDGGDYEKELYLNNALIYSCEYDHEAAKKNTVVKNEHDAYGALIDHKPVCEGYARAFQLLCGKLGIDCVYVSGTGEGELHGWNCAKISGEWYHIDVTWNDSGTENKYMDNYYFNLTDKEAYKDHKPEKLYSELPEDSDRGNFFVPTCNATKYSYKALEYVTLKDINDTDTVAKDIAKDAKNKEKNYALYIDDSLDFDQTRNALTNDGYVIKWIEEANKINGNSPKLNTECQTYYNNEKRMYIIDLKYV